MKDGERLREDWFPVVWKSGAGTPALKSGT
jgi:hypothetical protein